VNESVLKIEEPGRDALMFEASEYLDHMQVLGAELESAMQIVARNSLIEFQESVARQEILTARLADMSKHLMLPGKGDHPVTAPSARAEMAAQIRAANEHLQLLNRRYSALLRLSSYSVTLMLSLFKSSRGDYRGTSGSTLNHQTWSCRA
jgi:hypothetical protein